MKTITHQTKWLTALLVLALVFAPVALQAQAAPAVVPPHAPGFAPAQDGKLTSPAGTMVLAAGTAGITADTYYTGTTAWVKGYGPYDHADIFTKITMGTVNTATLTLMISPDNSNWFTATVPTIPLGALQTNVAATTSAFTTTTPMGLYFRIFVDVTNSSAITPTIKVTLH
jgi:hypothetical protein